MLGTETKNATYVGFGVNYAEVFKGVANLSDKDLAGTADDYDGEVTNTKKYYLYYFTRDCSGLEGLTAGHCVELSETMIIKTIVVNFTSNRVSGGVEGAISTGCDQTQYLRHC